jgi:hypothetical protein
MQLLLDSYKGQVKELAITKVIRIIMVEFTESIGLALVEV